MSSRVKAWKKILSALLLASFSLAASAEPGVSDTTILIGQTVGLTGIVALPVKDANEGANAYFNLVNKRGGIYGRKIELVTLDDKFDPALSAANAENLIRKQHVFALFLGRGTPHTQAILPVLAANRVPLIAPSTGATILRQPVNHWLFNVRANFQDEVAKGIEHFTTLGINSIGILHVDNSAGQDGLEGFTKAMKARRLDPAIIAKYPLVNPDYAATVNAIIKANPSALIIVSSSKNTMEIIKALHARGSHIRILTLSNNSSEGFVKDLGPARAGVIVTQVTPPPHLVTTVLGQEFKLAAKATGATVSYSAMEGFVAAKVLVEGLQRAGRNLTREGFISALESMHHVDLGGLMLNYGEDNHAGSNFVELTMIGKNGNFIR